MNSTVTNNPHPVFVNDFGIPETVTIINFTICGDQIMQGAAGETCDDGNANNGDGCDNNCTVTVCGNGIVTSGEICDDGNTTGGDGYSADCKTIEPGFSCPANGGACQMVGGGGDVVNVSGGGCALSSAAADFPFAIWPMLLFGLGLVITGHRYRSYTAD